MSTSTVEQKIRTPEEIAAIEAERRRQQAIFADAKAKVAKEQEEKENKFQLALSRRETEQILQPQEQTVHAVRQGIVFSKEQIDKIQNDAIDEIENDILDTSPVVEYVQTSGGEFLPSIPSFFPGIDEAWESVVINSYQPEMTRRTNGLVEIVQSERSLQAVLDKKDDGDIHVELSDLNDPYSQTRVKLSGTLHEEDGRMTYSKDEDVFFHYSSLVLTDQHLKDFSTLTALGEIIHVK